MPWAGRGSSVSGLVPITNDVSVTDDRATLYRRVAETLMLCMAGIEARRDPATTRTTDLVIGALETAAGDLAAWADELEEST